MRSFVLLLAFVAATLAGGPRVNTREDCPPEGYLVLSPMMDLSNLPSGRNYAICLNPDQAAEVVAYTGSEPMAKPFALRRGLWKMSDSILAVDPRIQINITYPARLEWSNVVVKSLRFENPKSALGWSGLNLNGYYKQGLKGSAAKVDQGNCGSLKNVAFNGLIDYAALSFRNCSSKTTLKGVKINSGAPSVFVEDSQLVAYDLTAFTDDSDDVVSVYNSNLAIVRPSLTTNTRFLVRSSHGSSVTLCDGFYALSSLTNSENYFVLGSEDDSATDGQNFMALTGKIGIPLPQSLAFQGQAGLYVTMKKCPSVFTSFYDRALWTGMYTNVAAP